MFYLGYFLGSLTFGISLLIALWLCLRLMRGGEKTSPLSSFPMPFKRAERKKPKSFTEEEEWLKEQREFKERI